MTFNSRMLITMRKWKAASAICMFVGALICSATILSAQKSEKSNLSFSVVARSGPPARDIYGAKPCASENTHSIDCVVFHYYIRNVGDSALRNLRSTCGFSGITPEFQIAHNNWQALQGHTWVCTSNVAFETPILVGRTDEGEFTLSTLPPGFDTTPLRNPGAYRMRFVLRPKVCNASADGEKCIGSFKQLPASVSDEIDVRFE